jgi:hypothetical protein
LSNRCPTCEMFVGLEVSEEIIGEEDLVFEEMTVEGMLTVNLCCVECGEELKYAELDAECSDYDLADFDLTEEEVEAWKEKHDGEEPFDATFTCSTTDRYHNKTRTGKPITNTRYMKRFYGVEVEVELKCKINGAKHSYSHTTEEQASGFEEM